MSVPVLETERLILREIVPGDAAALFEIFSSDDVTRFYDLATFTDISQAEQMIARMAARNAAGEAVRWGITLKDIDRVIGTSGFNSFMRPWSRAGIGYDLAAAYWNRGYATEALRAMLHYGFVQENLNRIEALVMPGNDASVRVLAKLGFQREGILRQYGYWKNEYWDLQMFSLLRSENVTAQP
jgi:[ribosomal protein S5]-alanine N-acetyltransferase